MLHWESNKLQRLLVRWPYRRNGELKEGEPLETSVSKDRRKSGTKVRRISVHNTTAKGRWSRVSGPQPLLVLPPFVASAYPLTRLLATVGDLSATTTPAPARPCACLLGHLGLLGRLDLLGRLGLRPGQRPLSRTRAVPQNE